MKSFVSQVCHWWCPPFSVGHVAFLLICLPGLSLLVSALSAVFICLPGLSLLVSALFRWPCSVSMHLSPRSVAAGVRPFPLAIAFLFICLPGLSMVVSALFRWRCNISIHLSPMSVTAGVRPFPLAMQHFYSFVSQVCHWWCPPFSAGHVAFLFICLKNDFCTSVSQVRCLHCWYPPFSAGHA